MKRKLVLSYLLKNFKLIDRPQFTTVYIVKDINADFWVIFSIVTNRPTIKDICTKIHPIFILHFCNILIFKKENKFLIFKLKQPFFKQIMGRFWNFSFQLSNPHYCPKLYCTIQSNYFHTHTHFAWNCIEWYIFLLWWILCYWMIL